MVARRKGPWSVEEDKALRIAVQRNGPRKWAAVCKAVPGRTGNSCRIRWFNQLSPQVDHRPFTESEDRVIIGAHCQLGNQWAAISRLLVGRTDNSVKNRWHAFLKWRNPPSLLVPQRPLPPPIRISGTVGEPQDPETDLSLALPGSWRDKVTECESNAIVSGEFFL